MLVIPTYKSGGMERVMNELGNIWSEQGHDIEIVFLTKHIPFYPVHPNTASVVMPNFTYRKKVVSKLWYAIRLFAFLRKKIKRSKADAVLSFGEGYNSFVLLASMFLGKKIFVSDRNSPFIKRKNYIMWLRNKLYPRAYGIIVQTQTSKNFLSKQMRNLRIKVIPNPIRTFEKIDQNIDSKQNIILNIGRLEEQKNQMALIRIFGRINMMDWELHILGEGTMRKSLEEEIGHLGLEDRVKLHGVRQDVGAFMSKSSIFAMTSIFEGYPNALLEAMAFPLASISYDCDTGPKELIEDGKNGYLVELNDEDQFEKKLKQLMNSPNIRAGFEAESSLIGKQQTVPQIAAKYLDFLLHENTH